MNSLPGALRNRDRLTIIIFLMVLIMGLALAWFVNRSTTQIREALAQEILQQQHDVASLLQEYANVMLAVERARNVTSATEEGLNNALATAQQQLERMRFQYTFERLDGAATAHAFAKPVLEDVTQWISDGIPGQQVNRADLLKISSQRLTDRYDRLRSIANETDEVARLLIRDQSDYLLRFRSSLIAMLGCYVLLALGFAALLIRQRNLQTQLRVDQERHAERIADFADIGADWFWEMTDKLKLRMLSNRELSYANSGASVNGAGKGSGLLADNSYASEAHWPGEALNERRQFSDYESKWITPDGDTRVLSMSGKPLHDKQSRFAGFRGIGRDVTEQKEVEQELENVYQELIATQRQGRKVAEDALRESEQFLSVSLDAMAPNIAILDKSATIKAANKAWRELTAGAVTDGGVGLHYVPALKSRPYIEQKILASIEPYIEDVLVGRENSFQVDFPCDSDKGIYWMDLNLTTFDSNGHRYAVLVYEDITEKRKLEDRDRRLRADLAHVARVNTAGEMASVLAHEINQPLTAISHNCDSLLSSNKSSTIDPVVHETLQDIYDQSQRAGSIIHSMRQMMRKETPPAARVDINELVKETVRLTTPEARESQVSVSLDLGSGLPEVMIDPVQIQQVLVNLERNGVESIRNYGSAKRELTIATELVDNSVVVSVRDTGPGISAEGEKSLFKSFRTTKDNGMGMGLSISRSIVEAHGGRLWLDQTGQGVTTFKFSLPVIKGEDNGNG